MKAKDRFTGIIPMQILLLLLLLMPVGMRAQVQEAYLEGIALADRAEYSEARERLQEALGHDRKNPETLLRLADVCSKTGDRDAAMEYLRQLESIDPGRGSYMLARLYAGEGNAEEAVRQLRTHLKSVYKLPSDVILLDTAFADIEQSPQWKKLWSGDWYTAEEEMLQEVRYLTGKGDYLQALEILDGQLKKNPGSDALYAARGRVLLKMGQSQGAAQAFSRAIEVNPSLPSYYHDRALARIAQGNYDRAVPDLEKAGRMAPENLELLLETGRACREAGLYRKAVGFLEKYNKYFPEDAESRYELGRVRFESADYLDALQEFNVCLRLRQDDPRFYAARGKAYLETKTFRYALNDFGMALDLDPGDAETWYLRGEARWLMNDNPGAVEDWKHAARLGSHAAAEKLVTHAGGK